MFHVQTDDRGAVRQEVPDPLATNSTSKNVAKGSWGAESTYLPPVMVTHGRQDKGRVDSRGFSVLGARENVFGQWPKKLKSTTTTRDATGLINTSSLSSGSLFSAGLPAV